jgi:hypothetical protein
MNRNVNRWRGLGFDFVGDRARLDYRALLIAILPYKQRPLLPRLVLPHVFPWSFVWIRSRRRRFWMAGDDKVAVTVGVCAMTLEDSRRKKCFALSLVVLMYADGCGM